MKEGFFGGVARGAGHPDCLRNLNEGPELLGMVRSAAGTADYSELQLILSKLGCLKQDIMGPSGIVEATRYQAYETAHDREPIAEVAATCLNRTISKRDLEIIFVTFKDKAGLETYLPHPAHQAFVGLVKPLLEEVHVLDYVAAH
jgi:hypothetical protein